MKTVGEKTRIEYFDWLRIWAALMVIMIHVCGPYWQAMEITSSSWQILNLYEGISRWAAPVYMMISGALFLGSSRSFRTIFRKNILHLVPVFVFWSALYTWINYAKGLLTVPQAVSDFFNGYYHMWYLHAIIGLYFAVPILRKIAESRKVTEYFLILSLVVNFVLPYLAIVSGYWNPQLQQLISRQLNNVSIHVAMGYSFYFLLGHYLHNTELEPVQKKWIYGLGIVSCVLTVVLTALFSLWQQQTVHIFFDYLAPNVALSCAGVFLFAKDHFCGSCRALRKVSSCCFGIYLMHPLLYDILRYNLWIEPTAYPLVLSIPVFALGLFAVALVITAVVQRIPGLRKWII